MAAKNLEMRKIAIGTNADGSIHHHFLPDDPATAHVVYTGPLTGSVKLADGSEYDVTDQWIQVESVDHAQHVSHAIGMRYETEGHPQHTDGTPFVHACADTCGTAADPDRLAAHKAAQAAAEKTQKAEK